MRPPSGPAATPGVAGPLLGRSVLVAPGQEPPAAWRGCDRAGADVDELEEAWRARTPLVIEVGEEHGDQAGDQGSAEVDHRPVWALSPSFTFPGERRAHVTFANAVDARHGALRWHLGEEAVRLGATAGGPADVLLPDGRAVLCDGGPLMWHEPIDGAAVVPRLAVRLGSLDPFGPNRADADLAPDQLAAVQHPGGAARVIAPAGSGKTRVLTERARHLLRRWRLPVRAVTLVAFNTRAADEIRERTPDLPNLQVRTLNALGLSLVHHVDHVTTVDERGVRSILDTLVDLPRRANTDPAAAWIEALSMVRLGLRDPAQVEAEMGGDVDGLPEVLERYRRLLADRRLIDFDEQVYRAIQELLADPVLRGSARARCRVLLVDELQDLTPAHLLLVRLLAGPDGEVYGVGDDDQTIYGYSGASPEWLVGYRRFFPSAGAHQLEVNYRCPVAVVDGARTLLSHNRHRVPKRILPAPGRSARPGELEVSGNPDTLAGTVEGVANLVAGGAAPNDIAVLSRVNASLAPVQVALVHRGIPFRRAVDQGYLTRGGVQAALAWVRLAISRDVLDGRDVMLAARRPSRALSPRVLEWMGEQGGVPALRRLAGRLGARDQEKVLGFVSDLATVQRRARIGTSADVLRAVRDQVGLDRAMELLEQAHRRLDRSAQTDDLDALVAVAALHPDPDGFEEWLRESLGHPGSTDGVVLSTIHRVKGREWPHVVLHEVRADLLPHRLAVDVEEERRIFHVGLTRGTTSVLVVAGAAPSPFVAEMTEEWTPERRQVVVARARDGSRMGQAETRRAHRYTGIVSRRGPGTATEAAVVAEIGLGFDLGGHHHEVVARSLDGVVATVGPARIRVPYGTLVATGGGQARLMPCPPAPEVSEQVRQGLRAWRSARAAAEGKPPFVYLHDRTIEEIAQHPPVTASALAAIPGIGPAKLEAYGDELLAVVSSMVDEATGGGTDGGLGR